MSQKFVNKNILFQGRTWKVKVRVFNCGDRSLRVARNTPLAVMTSVQAGCVYYSLINNASLDEEDEGEDVVDNHVTRMPNSQYL